MKKFIIAALALFPMISGASVIIGNPNTQVKHVAGGAVYLHSVVGHRCSSGVDTISVGQTLSSSESVTVGFAETSYCSVQVRVKWTPSSPVVTVPVSGFSVFKTINGTKAQTIDIDGNAKTASL